ncbi:MAG TPA: tRNA lysidine(34) synthetase TilS [Dongiaceae bacterium]
MLSTESIPSGASSAGEFARLIAPLGPFERNPDIAVGVSGGPDSMALALLLADWVAERGGRLFAITVDHGLRPESAAEARQVGAWLSGQAGVTHHILEWTGPKPKSGIQAAARAARYELMTDFCRANGILHLCVAHQLDDQWETYSMRAERGGTEHGLSGMSGMRPWRGARILRPLLPAPKRSLVEFLEKRKQAWVEDPSNSNRNFERVRQRERQADLALDPRASLVVMRNVWGMRQNAERDAATLLARTLAIDPNGFALLNQEFAAAPAPIAMMALGWVLQTVGGADYAPAFSRRRAALARMESPGWPGFTLGGCEVIGKSWENLSRALLCRDWGAIRDRRLVTPGASLYWDRRFEIQVSPDLPEDRSYIVSKLGERGVQWLGRNWRSLAGHSVPEPVRKGLAALWAGNEPIAVPQLDFGSGMKARFRPHQPATSCGFTVAY